MDQSERISEPVVEAPVSIVEREVKLLAGERFEPPALDDLPGVAQIVPVPEQLLTATYFDTPDLRLARCQITLRQRKEVQDGRERELWTLKLPADAEGVLLARHEITWPGALDQVPEEAIRLLRATTLGDEVHPVARLTTRRLRVEVRDPSGPVLAEIADDQVGVTSLDGPHENKGRVERFREIEIELATGVPSSLADVILQRFTTAGAAVGEPTPKLIRALGAAAQEPPDVVVPDLHRKSSAAEMVRASIAGAFVSLASHEPGLRLGGDIEHVHKARVATRRLRSDLRTFRSLLDPEWVAPTRGELRWAGEKLGAARDLDVLHERLRTQSASLGLEEDADLQAVDQLLARISAERSAAGTALVEALDSDRYLHLLRTLRDAALNPPLSGADAGARARYVAPALVHSAWKRTRKAASALGDPPADEHLHELRKRAKALRYGAEAATPFVGKPAAKLAKRAKALQDVLGELQDALVAQAWLHEHADAMEAPEALVAGQLIEHQRVLSDQTRAAWPKAWKKLRPKKLRAWLT
jgi:CHAD domain-containing protein